MTDDPYRAWNFTLLIEGTTVGGFVNASGLGASIDVIDYREAGAGQPVRHLPGLPRHDPLELTDGVTRGRELLDWVEATSLGTTIPRDISIVQFADDGMSEAYRWTLFSACPSQFRAGQMDVGTTEVVIDSLTLVYDRIERR
jgi:phage tail-like protein